MRCHMGERQRANQGIPTVLILVHFRKDLAKEVIGPSLDSPTALSQPRVIVKTRQGFLLLLFCFVLFFSMKAHLPCLKPLP